MFFTSCLCTISKYLSLFLLTFLLFFFIGFVFYNFYCLIMAAAYPTLCCYSLNDLDGCIPGCVTLATHLYLSVALCGFEYIHIYLKRQRFCFSWRIQRWHTHTITMLASRILVRNMIWQRVHVTEKYTTCTNVIVHTFPVYAANANEFVRFCIGCSDASCAPESWGNQLLSGIVKCVTDFVLGLPRYICPNHLSFGLRITVVISSIPRF